MEASGSVYDWSPICDTINNALGLAEEDWEMTATDLQPQRTIYLCVALYIYPINTLLKMHHKLLYAKSGVLD